MAEITEAQRSAIASRSDVPGGRLTLTSGTPVTTADVTGATTIYYTPYLHNVIPLWDGSHWVPTAFTETTLALGTLTADLPYDVFGYLSSGALALEKLAWTNATTRATAVTIQDGRYCKSGDHTRIYLGTFYTTSTTTTADSSSAGRYLWNTYNRVRRSMMVLETTDNWTYSTATYRQTNANTANQLNFVTGLGENAVEALATSQMSSDSAAQVNTNVAIGYDSTTTPTGITGRLYTSDSGAFVGGTAHYTGYPGIGRHFLAWLERGVGGATETWYGDNGGAILQTGISGTILA